MSEPTYLIWTPRVLSSKRSGPAIRFNVTPLSAVHWPRADRLFYAALCDDIGLPVEVVSWEVLAYRTRYHGDPTSINWRDRWKRNWRITLRCESIPGDAPDFEEGYETWAFDSSQPLSDDGSTTAMVLADFPDPESADRAQTAVSRLASRARIEVVEVEDLFWQLQIDLGEQPQRFFESDATEADEIERTCRDEGGWPTFDERVQVLG